MSAVWNSLPVLVYFCATIAFVTVFIIGTTLQGPLGTNQAFVSRISRAHVLMRTNVHRVHELSALLQQALKHVRGTKTSDSLRAAIEKLDQAMCKMRSRMVVGHVHGKMADGQGPHHKNMQQQSAISKPIRKLLTVLYHSKHNNNSLPMVTNFLKSFVENNMRIRIIISVKNKYAFTSVIPEHSDIALVETNNMTDGEAWNRLLEHVGTPYVLVSRNLKFFTGDIQIEHLVKTAGAMNVSTVAGSTLTPDGHWKLGCYQTAYKNYTLVYEQGYFRSKNACLFCDYTTSPFVTSTKLLRIHPFTDLNEEEAMFEDWFLKIHENRLQSLLCPNAMFPVTHVDHVKMNFSELMDSWNLYKLNFDGDREIVSTCFNLSTDPAKDFPPTLAVHPCALQENINVISFISNMCESDNLICEIEEGTNLGAVKFAKVLPWEYDGDMTYMAENYTGIMKQHKAYSSNGYRLWEYDTYYDEHMRLLSIGWLFVDNKMWLIEMYQRSLMDTLILKQQGISPTKVQFGDRWVIAPLNPGSFARNRYGREILRHVPHWRRQGNGTNGWSKYRSGSFRKCEHSGHMACLDQYNGDGTLQFVFLMT